MKIIETVVSAFQQNARLVINTNDQNRAFWVDPGDEADRLIELAEDNDAKVEAILLTHGHVDHIGDARVLADHYKVPLIGPDEADKMFFDSLAETCRLYGLPEKASFLPDRWTQHGETLELAGLSLDVVHAPGHSPGHMMFLHAPSKIALVGDVIFMQSIGRTDLPGGDHTTLLQSIKRELWHLEGWRLLCGHGASTNIEDEKRLNPFLQGL